ncbi:MAG: hypothetical protein JWL95_1145 [Gemmatimonadetes bacterium]|nr:hypothetical protein [Gemmatimonadota bacterium]
MTTFYDKQMLQIVSDYREAGGAWPAMKAEMVEWALVNKRWEPSRDDIRRMCGEALAEAMREVMFTDESGRNVRAMLPAKTTRDGEQGTFWDDVRTASIGHVRIGVAQRRSAITAECFSLFSIVRYSNEHRDPAEQIELSLDFSNDVREMDQPVKAKEVKRSRLGSPSSTGRQPRSAPLRRAPLASIPRPSRHRPFDRPSAPA